MSLSKFHNPFGGIRWKIVSSGIEVEGQGLLRTSGEPSTVIQIWKDYGSDILHASHELKVPVDMVVAMIPIEAVRKKGSLSYDPRSDRKEPGYVDDVTTPHRRSPGLMQTLITTAREMATRYHLKEVHEVNTELLFDPFYSILLGTAYIKRQIERYDYDPVLICGAYNAGSLRQTSTNRWKIMTYGDTRMDRYVSFYNDFIFAIDSGKILLPKSTILTRDFLTKV